MTYFKSAATDDALGRLADLDCHVLTPARDTAHGRAATVPGIEDARFALFQSLRGNSAMPAPEQQSDTPPPATAPEPVQETAGDSPSPSAEPIPAMPDHPPSAPASRWSRLSRGTVLAIGVGLGAAAVGACWAGVSLAGQAGDSFSTDGTLTVTGVGAGLDSGEPCSGTGGYSDIRFGTQVTDTAGALVAMGSLGPGQKTEQGCEFPFTVDDVTPGSKFYTVEVSHRGGLTQTEDQLREGDLAFTLGD